MDKFGVYDMQRSGVRLQPVRGGDVDEVELVLALKERGRLFLKAGTEVGGGEGGGVSHLSSLGALMAQSPESGSQNGPAGPVWQISHIAPTLAMTIAPPLGALTGQN